MLGVWRDHVGVGTEWALEENNTSEARQQSIIRLWYARHGITLFRNNVGALRDERGVPVRYGLANDSKAINQVMKSGDLIGWHDRLITPEMVGSKVAQFVSIECKKANWKFTGDKHELAQLKWIEIVNRSGGYAAFSNGVECVPS
jgi:hypothetical protein